MGAQGVAQFMPATAAEVGLDDPFDPFQALPASARFLRKLHDQFGNLGLAAAAYNAGSGRIQKWLSRQDLLPRETRAYVKIITGNPIEDWTEESKTVALRTQLPPEAPCEGTGGLSKTSSNVSDVPVVLASFISGMMKKADTESQRKEAAKLVAAKLVAAKKEKTALAASAKLHRVPVSRFTANHGHEKFAAAASLRHQGRHPPPVHLKQAVVAAKVHRTTTADRSRHLRIASAR